MIIESNYAFHHLHIIIAHQRFAHIALSYFVRSRSHRWILRIYLFIHCGNRNGWCKLEIVAQDSAEVFGKIL